MHPHISWRNSYFHCFYAYDKKRNGHQPPLLPVTCHVHMCLTFCQDSVLLWHDDSMLSWICFRKLFVRTLCIGKTLTFYTANFKPGGRRWWKWRNKSMLQRRLMVTPKFRLKLWRSTIVQWVNYWLYHINIYIFIFLTIFLFFTLQGPKKDAEPSL